MTIINSSPSVDVLDSAEKKEVYNLSNNLPPVNLRRCAEGRTETVNAWLTVAGAWLILFASIGNIYSFGAYQDFYTRVFLREFSPSQLGWMGSVQTMLPFAGGLVAGKLFDKGYFRHVVLAGSAILLVSLFMLSLAHEGQYYQVFLSQSIGVGLGAGLILAPTNGIVSLHFTKNRNLAYGIALTGVSLGAVALPIILNHLIPRIGFAKAVRVDAYIVAGCFAVGHCLLRIPESYKNRKPTVIHIGKFFRDPAYVLFMAGSMMVAFGIYFPLIYMQLFSVLHHIDTNLAFYSIAIINGSSAVGRLGANYMADKFGVWRLQVPVTILAGISIWSMLAINTSTSMIVICVFYGIFSGAWLSLTMGGLSSLASGPEEIGARIGIAFAICSLGLLGSIPAQGALLTDMFLWTRPVAFSGSMMFGASLMYALTWWLVSKKKRAFSSVV
ncbi:MFS general substrate transporter [Agrocybe pediades]|nr:MFS general substrate transporter [Agrocybe pediades]